MRLVETKEGVKGRLTDNTEYLIVGSIQDGLKVVEKIKVNLEDVQDLIKNVSELYFEISHFFKDLFNNLPSVIISDGKSYRRNELPAPGQAEDVIMYRCTEDANDVLFKSSGRNMVKAKDEMFYMLKDANYIY